MDFSKLQVLNQEKERKAAEKVESATKELASLRSQEVFVKSIQALATLIQNHTTQTVVLNQLKNYATSDDISGVESAVKSLLEELQTHENTDVTPVVDVLKEAVAELKSIPKDKVEIEIPEAVDYTERFKELVKETTKVLKAIQAQKLHIEAPVVNVEAPTVNVDAPDLKPLTKEINKEFSKAIKSIVFPEYKVDLSKLEKEAKEHTKLLKDIREVTGGGSSGSTSIAPFLVDGQLPVANASLDLQVDDTGTYTYLGNATPGTATSASGWRIKRVVNATGVITHADGVSTFTKTWDDRATYTY